MTGMAALAICAAFTSCSKDTDVYNQNVVQNIEEQKKQDALEKNMAKVNEQYAAAFVNAFGQVGSNVDWGFGSSIKANTRAANTEHNQWAAVDNIYKLLVPPALTPGQIQRVKAYFQNNRYLTYEDPHMTDFFVQQVYEGSTDPGALSSEVYTAGNGARVVAGDHMDKLTVGVAETHVNDFNSADCGESTVLNNGTKQNDYVPDGTTHQDKITLMLGESTEYVGFWCSEGSVQHNDCCALAGADVIDAWAASDEAKALGIDLGEAVVDGWDRSFVGLDYEQISPENLFREKYVWPDGNRSEVKVWDFCSDTNNTHKVMLNGQLVDANTVPNDQLFFPNGEPVKWVDDNTNMYLGQNLGTNQNTFNKQENGVKYYDLDAVYACINQGAYPKVNNMEFIKGLGGRDYVFSDWIVTLTPAKHFEIDDIPTPTYRVIAEDLNAEEASDFDFNDVVFDVEPNEAGTAAKIVVRAAGGIYKLTVAGHEVHAAFGENVKDDGLYPMINTKPWDPEVKATLIESYSGDFSSDAAIRNTIKNIEIKVYKPGFEENGIELYAQTGKPACKILVDQTFKVVTERTGIADENTNFHKYVQGTWDTQTNGFWWKKN